ncbi:3-hydroxyisobutyrate dehydrogenase [Paenibacillus cellulosilyticus]|uniref:3-hydroxyisobutyrate dehydrogenase n=1 Tax=Paenibacillus cellulosilyticus TaxID=375489 RepID=A0A2V2Z089_9BACL|nr:NAD(P)-binding domain-containing protein [Paenibacillus cellulosilyticus]PWW08789.1 3-hydroxyisobutyrate dehydrogenase [Paenibacillus cellulosilyticus]
MVKHIETPKSRHDELRAGVIGLGMIGGGVAVSLSKNNRIPNVYDVFPEAADKLKGVPKPLASPAEVAKVSDVVMVAVVNAEQARQVIYGENGLFDGADHPLTIVLLSTISHGDVLDLAQRCAKRGIGFLDCGVTRGDKAAEQGLVAILGGDQDTVNSAMPVLNDWAKEVVHCGPIGAGMAAKIARNLITFGTWSIVAEAEAIATAAGINLKKLVDIIEGADPQGETLLTLLKIKIAGTPKEIIQQQIQRYMEKDLSAAGELASELALNLPLRDVAEARMRFTLGLE